MVAGVPPESVPPLADAGDACMGAQINMEKSEDLDSAILQVKR